MKTIKITVGLGLVGCKRQTTIEVEDGFTEDEIDETVREAVQELVDWHWEEVEPGRTK